MHPATCCVPVCLPAFLDAFLCWQLQEKQAAEVSQQAASDSSGLAAADEEAQLQQQLQELTAKIADLDEGG